MNKIRLCEEEINWKGIRDYLTASRILTEHSSVTGPKIHITYLIRTVLIHPYTT
jgi:hypothetical protein